MHEMFASPLAREQIISLAQADRFQFWCHPPIAGESSNPASQRQDQVVLVFLAAQRRHTHDARAGREGTDQSTTTAPAFMISESTHQREYCQHVHGVGAPPRRFPRPSTYHCLRPEVVIGGDLEIPPPLASPSPASSPAPSPASLLPSRASCTPRNFQHRQHAVVVV